jgi:hypothetical protein
MFHEMLGIIVHTTVLEYQIFWNLSLNGVKGDLNLQI